MRLLSLLIATVVYTVASPIRENDEMILFDDGTWDGYPAPPQLSMDVNDFRCTKSNGLCCAGDDNSGDGIGGPDGETGPVLFNCLSSMRFALFHQNITRADAILVVAAVQVQCTNPTIYNDCGSLLGGFLVSRDLPPTLADMLVVWFYSKLTQSE